MSPEGEVELQLLLMFMVVFPSPWDSLKSDTVAHLLKITTTR